MRKLASIFLALLMVFLCIPCSTVSAETTSLLNKGLHTVLWLHLVTLLVTLRKRSAKTPFFSLFTDVYAGSSPVIRTLAKRSA